MTEWKPTCPVCGSENVKYTHLESMPMTNRWIVFCHDEDIIIEGFDSAHHCVHFECQRATGHMAEMTCRHAKQGPNGEDRNEILHIDGIEHRWVGGKLREDYYETDLYRLEYE